MDFTDPNLWKLPAALIDYWKTIFVGAVAILTALGTFLRWGLRPFQWARSKIAQRPRSAQTAQTISVNRPLRFVQNEQQSFWGPAMNGQEPGTQVAGHWHVTNTSDRNVVLLRARLDGYPRAFTNFVATEGQHSRMYSSTHPIPARHMAQVTVNLVFFPPITSGAEPLVADIIFTDNFEDEHHARSRFRYIRA